MALGAVESLRTALIANVARLKKKVVEVLAAAST